MGPQGMPPRGPMQGGPGMDPRGPPPRGDWNRPPSEFFYLLRICIIIYRTATDGGFRFRFLSRFQSQRG
jgi:hypothetical protein